MENTKKLTGKDLINVGIYTAMTLVTGIYRDGVSKIIAR